MILTPASQLYEKNAHRGHKAIHDHTSVRLFVMCFLTPGATTSYILGLLKKKKKKGEKAHEKQVSLFVLCCLSHCCKRSFYIHTRFNHSSHQIELDITMTLVDQYLNIIQLVQASFSSNTLLSLSPSHPSSGSETGNRLSYLIIRQKTW